MRQVRDALIRAYAHERECVLDFQVDDALAKQVEDRARTEGT